MVMPRASSYPAKFPVATAAQQPVTGPYGFAYTAADKRTLAPVAIKRSLVAPLQYPSTAH